MKRWTMAAVVLLWLGWHLAVPINLTVADIGRHIKNGELIWQGQWDVLYENFYSYTFGRYPFLNHHWLFGVLVYPLWRLFDFTGLSLIYVAVQLATFWLFFRRAERFSSLALACAFGLLSFPLLTYRIEIRPEGLSMFFCGLFWLALEAYQHHRCRSHHLKIFLIFLQVLWVNTHIFFIMGPMLTALFWWQAKIDGRQDQIRILKQTLGLVLGMCLVNPSGLWGALAPLNIFKGFGYALAENQSVYFMYRRFPQDPAYLYLLIAFVAVIVPWVLLAKRDGWLKHAPMLALTLFLSVCAMKAVRLMTPFGFFWIPLSAFVWSRWMQPWRAIFRKILTIALVIAGILVSVMVRFSWQQRPSFGLLPLVNNSAQFFKQAGLLGRIFNNYDIGGYLIFHLAPSQKFFVDNRQEAFPANFFKEVYIPMQENDAVWQKMDARYDFNVIFFDRHELTPWGQEFLIKRVSDSTWAPVFVDDYTIIFLKRNALNAGLIRRYELPASMFRVQKF